MSLALVTLVTVGVLVLTASAQGPEPPAVAVVPAEARFAEIRRGLVEKVRAGRIPSVSIAVAERGTIVWEEAVGWSDRERSTPATPATSYALGSLSKSLAATGILTLVDRGVVGLDAPIDPWVRLPAPTGIFTQPTLRQLLDASGGVPHGWREMSPADAPADRRAWDDWIDHSGFLAFAPGTVFAYSNNSFGVAARIAERAAGMPFADVMRRSLFDPLGMTSSAATIDRPGTHAVAVPYGASGTALERTAAVPEAGLGMYASAIDLARFGRFVRGHAPAPGPAPLSPGLRATIWQPAVGPSRDFFHFGFWNGGRTLVTNGNIAGANAHLRR